MKREERRISHLLWYLQGFKRRKTHQVLGRSRTLTVQKTVSNSRSSSGGASSSEKLTIYRVAAHSDISNSSAIKPSAEYQKRRISRGQLHSISAKWIRSVYFLPQLLPISITRARKPQELQQLISQFIPAQYLHPVHQAFQHADIPCSFLIAFLVRSRRHSAHEGHPEYKRARLLPSSGEVDGDRLEVLLELLGEFCEGDFLMRHGEDGNIAVYYAGCPTDFCQ